ncbi:MAG: sialate O-acetylesterase [Bacteroidota bacterium]
MKKFPGNSSLLISCLRHLLGFLIVIILFGCTSTEVYIMMGQSNMAGRGPIDSIANTYLSEQVLMLTKDDSIIVAKHPLHFDKPKIAGVGPGIMFGYDLSQNTRNQILLVPCAVGGTSIKLWSPGMHDKTTNTFPYDDALRRIEVAMQSGKLSGVLWHQGEADRRSEKYLDDLVELIQRIRDFAGDDDLPFVVGELGYFLEDVDVFNKNLREELPKRLNNVAVVSAEGLTHKGDEVHFDARSAEILGKRYAEALKKLR